MAASDMGVEDGSGGGVCIKYRNRGSVKYGSRDTGVKVVSASDTRVEVASDRGAEMEPDTECRWH